MFKQMNLTDLLAAIKERVEAGTDLTMFDHTPINEPSPLVYGEVVGVRPADTKTMYCKIYEVYLHVIAEESISSIPINHHIQHVQEAMTEDIVLPVGLTLVSAMDEGIQTIKDDESGEKHAVLLYSFKISYGFKAKE